MAIEDFKFKGITTDTGKWQLGYGVINGHDGSCIIHKQGINLSQHTDVIPNTVCQYIWLTDKKNVDVYVGDKLRIRVERKYYGNDKNVHHGAYYVTCVVLNVRGELKYNDNEIEELRKPKGKETKKQSVGYDNSLFGHHVYYCIVPILDENGERLVVEKPYTDSTGYECIGYEYPNFMDIEVIGNIHDNKLTK